MHAELCLFMPACVHSCLWIHALARRRAHRRSIACRRPRSRSHFGKRQRALWRSASLLRSLGKVRRAIDAYHAMLRHQPTDVRIGKELALLYAPPHHTFAVAHARLRAVCGSKFL